MNQTTDAPKATQYTREYYYVRRKYITSTREDHLMQNGMYVEELSPVSGSTKTYPLTRPRDLVRLEL